MILAASELERYCMRLLKHAPKASNLSVLVLLELSRCQNGQASLRYLHDRIRGGGNLRSSKEYSKRLEALNAGSVEYSRRGEVTFASLKIDPDFLTVDENSGEGRFIAYVHDSLMRYYKAHRDATPLACLILLAVLGRGIRSSPEINDWLGISSSRHSVVPRILGRMNDLGILKTISLSGGGSKAKLVAVPLVEEF